MWLRSVGMKLDAWQEKVVRASLCQRDGRGSAMDVGLNVARQNGKGEIIIARILVELYLVGAELTIYSAHNFDTAMQHFRRLVSLIEDSEELSGEVVGENSRPYGITWGKGNEGVELKGNRRFEIRTRTAGGGRGFSADLLILDEAMMLSDWFNSALRPIVSARSKPQIWTVGSAVDQEVHEHGIVFARMREAAIKGADPDLTYFEWSAGNGNPEDDHPDRAEDLDDQAAWAQANPALGTRIALSILESDRRGRLSDRGFAVERLGLGDWPRTDYVATNPLDFTRWMELADEGGVIQEPQVVVFDVSPERKGAVVIAGKRKDGLVQGELVESKGGTAWVAPRVAEIVKKHKVEAICDGRGPAASLVPEVRDRGMEVQLLTSSEHAQACGQLMDGVERGAFRHLNDPDLNVAVRAACTRPLGDAWAWSRKDSNTNIAPLVAFTLAVSAAMTAEKPKKVSYAWA
jgi:hypothetical protein